jgi:hypothetical protein
MTTKIKFSNEYLKFGNLQLPIKCKLFQCFKIHYDELSRIFKNYDTRYFADKKFTIKSYDLPKTELIVLLLAMNIDSPPYHVYLLTTIRRYTPRKWEYYKSREGKMFELVKA